MAPRCYLSDTTSHEYVMATTSLKLPDELKERAAKAAQELGISPHAFMVDAIRHAADAVWPVIRCTDLGTCSGYLPFRYHFNLSHPSSFCSNGILACAGEEDGSTTARKPACAN